MKKRSAVWIFGIIVLLLSAFFIEPPFVFGNSGNNQNYTYDSAGRLNYIDSRSGRVSFQYDLQGNLTSKVNEVNLVGLYTGTSSIFSATSQYSSTQGQGNWYYQEWDGTKYTDLKYKNNQWEGLTPYTIILNDFQHPDQTDSVRKWVAPKSGMIQISGIVAKSNTTSGDGIVAKVLKNDIQLWSKTVAYNDSTGYEVGLTVGVSKGDAIYFVVNKNAEASYDGTTWKPVIAYMEASSAQDQYSSTQGQGNWYYQEWDGTKYTDLKYKNNQWEGLTPYTIILNDFQHPDQTDSVRKWIAPKSGMIRISGNVAKSSTGGGDGIVAKVLKNKMQLWSKTIAYNDAVGYEVGLTVGVSKGDAIYFVVNKNAEASYDGTTWKPVIAYMEASSAQDQYSSTQGQGNWYYQEWDGTKYTDLKYKNNQWEGLTPYTIILNDFQHPDQTDSVRKWIAPKSGKIRISGNVAKSSTGGGDGIVAKVLKNKMQLWSKTIAYNDAVGYEVGLTVGVSKGDAIYFVVNKNAEAAYDGTIWRPVIAFVN
ncbi:hypothetical protein H70357_10925 [Paenibacillus sp. FSL H7-0357]|uniref:hypothetical protein n=1 Tax=Paenibacillus sp. FSL H7-0357 TaxID=1536774 RepID=UPI0004F64809|nr:hypothetical protein [Paenibacillus sp. FSL H7-0357]AIQ17116.1 hypothetical protein H70357_10925 [Paenibacillus sp. FSL H7-0357]